MEIVIYMLNNNIINKTHYFYFLVSEKKLLTKNSELCLKENKKLKYKVILFE